MSRYVTIIAAFALLTLSCVGCGDPPELPPEPVGELVEVGHDEPVASIEARALGKLKDFALAADGAVLFSRAHYHALGAFAYMEGYLVGAGLQSHIGEEVAVDAELVIQPLEEARARQRAEHRRRWGALTPPAVRLLVHWAPIGSRCALTVLQAPAVTESGVGYDADRLRRMLQPLDPEVQVWSQPGFELSLRVVSTLEAFDALAHMDHVGRMELPAGWERTPIDDAEAVDLLVETVCPES